MKKEETCAAAILARKSKQPWTGASKGNGWGCAVADTQSEPSAQQQETIERRHLAMAGELMDFGNRLLGQGRCSPWELCMAMNVVSANALLMCADSVPDKSGELCDASLSHFTGLVARVRSSLESKNADGE